MEYNPFGASRWPDNMRIAIVANGNPPKEFLSELKKTDVVIGVDRAAYWLITHGIIPGVAIGDFDSVNKKELAVIKKNVSTVKIFSPEKDFTDTELAIHYAVKQKPIQIIIYGGNGTRMDHVLATLFFLERSMNAGIPVILRDRTNEVMMVGRGRTILKKRRGFRYVSVLPVTQSIRITLRHFKYEITRKTIYRGQTIGISNEFAGRLACAGKQAQIIILRGTALIIQSRD